MPRLADNADTEQYIAGSAYPAPDLLASRLGRIKGGDHFAFRSVVVLGTEEIRLSMGEKVGFANSLVGNGWDQFRYRFIPGVSRQNGRFIVRLPRPSRLIAPLARLTGQRSGITTLLATGTWPTALPGGTWPPSIQLDHRYCRSRHGPSRSIRIAARPYCRGRCVIRAVLAGN